ncbi:MAG: FtsX-like permease family protein, partial [bacterium]|nr:FtsX-like permease family protein [bacterium]
MFKNYLKITFRNLIKHKSYTFINISGLALGIACTILILAYIGFELSYDKFHENHENIYRAAVSGKIAGRYIEAASVPAPFGPTIIQDYPEVLDAVRFRTTGQRMFSYQDKKFYENDLIFADNSILSVFSFELLKGDPETALKTGYSLIITPEIAEKYFGNEDPIGKILKMNNDNEYTVTGIVKEPPGNTHFTFSMIASFETLYKSNPRLGGAWFNFNYQTYILLRDGIDHKEFESKINEFLEKYLGAMMKAMGAEDFKGFLQPLPSIHLHSNLEEGEFGNNGDIKYVYAFLAIAVFILMIACINFMNLSTARSANRAKEVGLRKVHGAERRNLIIQFLGESIIFSIISLGIALVLVQLASPYFNSLAGQEIDINYLNSPLLFSSLFIIVIFVGIAAGSYPAFFLSGFKPSQVLKGDIQQGAKHSRFRSILVVSQFAISIALIIGTAIIYNQVDYLKNKNLGFNKEQLLVLKIQDNETRSKAETIKNEMTGFDGVISAAASTMVPGEENLNNSIYFPEGMGEDQGMLMDNFNIDHEFINTYEIEILKGREFSKDITTDTENGVLINETTIRALGWDD